jgi:membrane-bound lytic murein transglycosylase B
MADAIGSVANYFKVHGWKTNQPIAHRAKLCGDGYQNFVSKDNKNPKPIYKLHNLIQNGIYPTDNRINKQDINVSFLELDNGNNKKEYWLGRDNFYVITRYNHSINYAMAVFHLAQELDAAFKQNKT